MRLNTIGLQWFRGAGNQITLALNGKSVVVYGPNGSGKSSFVDAVEYILNDGKIGHLTHEYSGKKQEKGVINTHKPALEPTRISIGFADASTVDVVINSNGSFRTTGDGIAHLAGLDYRRLVLRQDEVAAFVSSAKGQKYSALLPLLGLEPLELAAENVRQLAKRVAKVGRIDELRASLESYRHEASSFANRADLEKRIKALAEKYCVSPDAEDWKTRCQQLDLAISTKVRLFTPLVQRHAAVAHLAEANVQSALDEVEAMETELAKSSVKRVEDKIALLERAAALVGAENDDVIVCPACGQQVDREKIAGHVAKEQETFAAEQLLAHRYRDAVAAFERTSAAFRSAVMKTPVAQWLADVIPESASNESQWFDEHDVPTLKARETRTAFARRASALRALAQEETKNAPPSTVELVTDSSTARAASAFLEGETIQAALDRLDRVIAYLNGLESCLREQIRTQSDAIIADISKDIQRMWSILHPDQDIKDVRLSHPTEADKAIDIELTFFGVDLKSPRLTLSEGNRNSLGLCVFLSMAKRATEDTPVILDDVVVSLDRDHRGMIVDLLQKEFGNRQVVVFTHDREWFAELRRMLPEADWQFLALSPYGDPTCGSSWTKTIGSLDDARGYLDQRPDIAANVARKVMDTELALLAEKLKLRMEYRQDARNDHRMAHEFLVELGKVSKKAFQRRKEKAYEADANIAVLLAETDRQLTAWGNRGSHTFDVAEAEAARLIDTCEKALSAFRCSDCEKMIYKLDDGSGVKQCQCGAIRWKYDKQ